MAKDDNKKDNKKDSSKKDISTIDGLLEAMDKAFGSNALIEFDNEIAPIEVVSTGIPSMDWALGVGGLPRGRIVEIYGPEGSGKTALALKTIAWCQANAGRAPRSTYIHGNRQTKPISGRCGFIDMEHALDPLYASAIHGVRIGKGTGFHFAQPNSGVEAMDMLEYMVGSGLFDVIVVDSVAAMTTDAEVNSSAGDHNIAQVAQLLSSGLKKLAPMINKSQTCVIFINQIREKPAVMFGSNETTPGGRALKFYASVRIRTSKGEPINDGTSQVGHKWKAKVVKNKVAPPFRITEVDLYYVSSSKRGKDAGFDTFSDLITTARNMGIVELGGSQYRYVDKSTGEILMKTNGLVACKEFLGVNPHIVAMIEEEMLGGVTSGQNTEPDEQE